MAKTEEYKSMISRINLCRDSMALRKAEHTLDNLWNNGIFTVIEFRDLDLYILERILLLDD